MKNTAQSSVSWKFIRNSKGQGLTEYLILLILISVVSITAARTLGTTIKAKIQVAREHINKDITVEDAN